MRDIMGLLRSPRVLRGATCVAAALVIGSCDGTSSTDQVEQAQGVLGSQVDFHTRGAVVTSRNDNARTGANLNETALKPSNVNVNKFGLRYTRQLDGKVYAQPLYVPNVLILSVEGYSVRASRHDVVYVVTEHNTVSAFDANDDLNPTPLWSRTLGPSVPSVDVNVPGRSCLDITPEIGISATPTIDVNQHTMYVVAKVEEAGVQNHRIFALDIRTGENMHAPVDIHATVPGTASDSVNGMITFDPVRHNVRAGLLLDQGVLYVAGTSHCDFPPWHGWIFAYQAQTLEQKAVWISSPDGEASGVWQSGAGLSADNSGIYALVGNGTYEDGTMKAQNSFGQSIVKFKLTGNTLNMLDWFTPYNVVLQNFEDADLASAPLLVPDTNLVVGMSRGGRVPLKQAATAYVLPRDNFGHFHSAQTDEVAQTVNVSDPDDKADPTNSLLQRAYDMVYFKGPSGPRLYCWTQHDFPRAYDVQTTKLNPTPSVTGTLIAASTTVTGMLSISASGGDNGIVWGTINVDNSDKNIAKTLLAAFDATTLTTLWTSRDNQARDEVGTWGKWAYPTVAGGLVFVGNADSQLKAYGLLP
jgi:hypothetical protein